MTDYYCQLHGVYFEGSTWSTGLHVSSSQSESALLTTFAAAVVSAWTDGAHGLEAIYPVGTVLTSVSVATLNGTMREISKSVQTMTHPGTLTGDTLPLLNSALVSLRSHNIQKKGRGRLYLPAPEETLVNGDVVVPAAVTRIKAAWQAVFSAINADGSTVFVFNRKDTSALHPPVIPAFTKEVITTVLASNKPARQSRRVKRKAAIYT